MDKNISAQEEPVVKSLETPSKVKFTPKILVIFLAIILLGVGSGFAAAKLKPSPSSSSSTSSAKNVNPASMTKGTIVGSDDLKTFKDIAEGTVDKGGINGEGQYHLVRPGGDSQNVYLTSSSVDLSLFIGKKIKVWGQTQAAQYAGWLMDVGRVEVE